jgi:hypothetical protein
LCCPPTNRCPGCDGCLCGRRVLVSARPSAGEGGRGICASCVVCPDGGRRPGMSPCMCMGRISQWWLPRSTGTVLPCRPERNSHLPHSASPGNSRRPTIFSLRPEQRWRGVLRLGDAGGPSRVRRQRSPRDSQLSGWRLLLLRSSRRRLSYLGSHVSGTNALELPP